jgi:hypothetical protein
MVREPRSGGERNNIAVLVVSERIALKGNGESDGLVCTKPVIKKRHLARMVLPWQNKY